MNIKLNNMVIDFLKNKQYQCVKIDNSCTEGHGHTLSVKVVMPTFCQANCPFCFNKLTRETQKHNWELFKENLHMSLRNILENANNREISLDITGNEPTFNIQEFASFMKTLDFYKNIIYPGKIDKIVLTTNGYHLYECIPFMKGVVDIVNISLHKCNYEDRINLFRTKYIPSNEDLKSVNILLAKNNIKSTSVAVVAHECNFKNFVENFVRFSKEVGFVDTRIRIDFTTFNPLIKNMFNVIFKDDEVINIQNGLSSKYFDIDGFSVSIYSGVPELIDYVIGVEMVIDDNGLIYLDYNKKLPLSIEDIKLFDQNIYIIN